MAVEDGGHLFNRLTLASRITGLEAYLGDTLIKTVLVEKPAMARLMKEDTELQKEKFTLVEIAADRDLAESKVQEYLRSIVYHNLPKVDFLLQYCASDLHS